MKFTRTSRGSQPRWVPMVAAIAGVIVASQLITPLRHLMRLPDLQAASSLSSSLPMATTAAAAARVQPAAEVDAAEAAAATEAASGDVPGGSLEGAAGSGASPADLEVSQEHRTADLLPGTFTCEASGYCSKGKVKTWRGDVGTNAKLREMLEAVAYKKEIIIAAFNSPKGIWAEMTINLVKSAEDLGLSNLVLVASEESVCTGLPQEYSHVSCLWDTGPSAGGQDVSSGYIFWAKRFTLTARMVRMGYNVMAVDTDAMFHHDPYVFLKQGPLAKYNVMWQKDGPDSTAPGHLNCGVTYFQNCHPSGAALWGIIEHNDRTFRQREGFDHMKKVYPEWNYGYTWDQGVWQDILYTLMSRTPRFTFVRPIANEEWKAVMDADRTYKDMTFEEHNFPPEWLPVLGETRIMLGTIQNMTVPRPPNETWWKEHSHLFYPAERSPNATAFLELLRDAAPEYPIADSSQPWEPKDPPPPENAAFLPNFFVTGYVQRGVHVFGAHTPVPQVVSHLVYVQTDSASWKMYQQRGQYWWHWDITETFNKDTGGNVLGIEDPKLLMLAPGAHLLLDTEQDFRDAVKMLAVLAQSLGRRPVVPPVPCDSPWVGVWADIPGPLPSKLRKWNHSYDPVQVLQFPDRQRPGHSYCHWNRCLNEKCVKLLVPQADAVAFLERSLTQEQRTPSEANTLWFEEWQAAGGVAAVPGASATVSLTMEKAVEAASAPGFTDIPVLFLGAAPKIEGPVGDVPAEMNADCCALFTNYDLRNHPDFQKARQELISKAGGANLEGKSEG